MQCVLFSWGFWLLSLRFFSLKSHSSIKSTHSSKQFLPCRCQHGSQCGDARQDHVDGGERPWLELVFVVVVVVAAVAVAVAYVLIYSFFLLPFH